MRVGGVDIGSLTSKAVILNNKEVIASHLIFTGPDSVETSYEVIDGALKKCGLARGDLQYIISTGYGRVIVPYANQHMTEIACHARGTHELFPEVRTILDMGGQDCKAIRCNGEGRVVNFAMNDKCAAGTGRYLEGIAKVLKISLDEMGPRSLEIIRKPSAVSPFCAVFAESDVVRLLREGEHVNDILAGAHEAIVNRIYSLLSRVGIENDFSISGGVARNIGITKRLEVKLKTEARIHSDPQMVGAFGAALFAREKIIRKLAQEG